MMPITLDVLSLVIMGATILVIGALLGLVIGYWLAPGRRSRQEHKPNPNWSERLRLYRDLKAHRLIVEMDGKAFTQVGDLPGGAVSRLRHLLQELQDWVGASRVEIPPPAPAPEAASSPAASRPAVAPTKVVSVPPAATSPTSAQPASSAAPTVAASSAVAPGPAAAPPPTVVALPRPAAAASAPVQPVAPPATPPPTAEPPAGQAPTVAVSAPSSPETIPLKPATTVPLPPAEKSPPTGTPPPAEVLPPDAIPVAPVVVPPPEKVKAPGVIDILARAIGGDPNKAAAPKSLAAQVDEILQERLLTSPLRERGIRLLELPDRGLVVMVGLEQFEGVDQVPYPEVQALIRECVAEWERRLEK